MIRPIALRATTRRMIVVRIGCTCMTAALVASLGCQSNVTPKEGARKPVVTVVISKKMTIPILANPIGTTRALRDVTIRARVKGFLERKFFDEGKDVKEGQELLVIEKRPYQIKLDLAKAELAAAEAGLKKAMASKANVVSRARLALDEAQLRLDEIEERRERTLLARKAVSQEDFDKADAQRKKSAAQVDADRASLEEAEADYLIDIENARADVARAKSNEADAALNLEYCTMARRSPAGSASLKSSWATWSATVTPPSSSRFSSSTRWGSTCGPPLVICPTPPCSLRWAWPSTSWLRASVPIRIPVGRSSSTTRLTPRPRRSCARRGAQPRQDHPPRPVRARRARSRSIRRCRGRARASGDRAARRHARPGGRVGRQGAGADGDCDRRVPGLAGARVGAGRGPESHRRRRPDGSTRSDRRIQRRTAREISKSVADRLQRRPQVHEQSVQSTGPAAACRRRETGAETKRGASQTGWPASDGARAGKKEG